MKKLTQKLKAKKGLIIVEVILSLFVFSLGLGGATMLVFSAIDVNARNENRIISINLAREGIEAIRNMRDTNWMTWSANRRECWNFWDNTNEDTSLNSFDDACTVSGGINNHPIGRKADGTKIKDFIVNFDKANYRWILIPKTNTYGMTEKLYLDADGLYTHNPTDNQETNFSRVVTVEYLDTADGFYPDGANPEARDNRMIVTSKVFWQKSGYTKEISLAQTLTDYYGRTNAND